MIDIVWDMETDDPDDFLTLLFLADHPDVNLKAVTIFPGSAAQVGLVRHALEQWFGLNIPIGARNLDTKKQTVSQWHYDAYGNIAESRDAQPADEILRQFCDHQTTLLMGAPLTNLRTAIRNAASSGQTFEVGHLIIQGGFAGEGIVPPHLQLDKFKGLAVCPTHNLIVDRKATVLALSHDGFGIRRFVSKNVCHRVIYDQKMHELISTLKHTNQALSLIWQGMDVYLKMNPDGKMLHDVLAACCALNPAIGQWAEVELYREGNAWGAKPAPGSNTWIIVDYDHEAFIQTLTSSTL